MNVSTKNALYLVLASILLVTCAEAVISAEAASGWQEDEAIGGILHNWHSHVDLAHSYVKEGKGKQALDEMHLALEVAEQAGKKDGRLAVATMKALAQIYRALGQEDKSRQLIDLLLTPHSYPQTQSFLRAHNELVRKKNLIAAGDKAAHGGDYLLADIFYSAVLPSDNLIARLFHTGSTADDFEMKVVDRLVRLYLSHGDDDRAELLIGQIRHIVEAFDQSKRKEDSTRLKLAMLDTDLGLVRMKQGRLDESIKLFEKGSVRLQRLLGPNDLQLATVFNDYAHACDKKGRTGKAISLYRKSVELLERNGGARSLTIKTVLANYSKLLHREGKDEQAEPIDARLRALR